MKISIIHMKVRSSLKRNLDAATRGIYNAAEKKPSFIALPEYFSVPDCMENFSSAEAIWKKTSQETVKFLSQISGEIPDIYLLGGTVLEEEKGEFFNTSTIWKHGSLIGKYRKKNPIIGEINAGVARGHEPVVVVTEFCKIGMLICADMFDQALVKQVASLGAEVVYLPVAAMGTHPSVKGHPLTEKTAAENGMFVIKVGNVCSNTKGGRSAIIAPWGIIKEVSNAPKDVIMSADIDLERLRDYRRKLNES